MRLNTEAEEAQRHLGDQSMSKDPKVEPECLSQNITVQCSSHLITN